MAEQKFIKKTEYHNEDINFIGESEITVTITLKEYRDLISSYATKKADIDKANNDKYSRDIENRELKETVQILKDRLLNLVDDKEICECSKGSDE